MHSIAQQEATLSICELTLDIAVSHIYSRTGRYLPSGKILTCWLNRQLVPALSARINKYSTTFRMCS